MAMQTIQKARAIHAMRPAIDGHADSMWRYLSDPGGFFGDRRLGHLDSRRLRETGQNVQVMAIYTPPEHTGDAALRYGLDFLHAIDAMLDSPLNGTLTPPYRRILAASDLEQACRPGGFGFLLFLEGASPLNGSLSNLELFHQKGIRGITITHNHDNEAARGCFAEGADRGLTAFGREMVAAMDRLGMTVDLAHSNEDAFWDVIACAHRPLIDSHTGLRVFWDHPRNLRDEQVKAIAATGGVVCIDFLPDHLCRRPEPKQRMGLDQVVRVITHAVETAGIDHVGLGADWDGFEETVEGLEDCAQLPRLTAALLDARYSDADAAKIIGGNLKRALAAGLS
jgi:membrane dipeptidase